MPVTVPEGSPVAGRVLLRRWEATDVGFVFDMYSRWEVQRYLGTTPRVMESVDEATTVIERWRDRADGPFGVWAVTLVGSGQPVGSVLLKALPLSGPDRLPSNDFEIGWHLHPDSWGRGYATEAALLLLDRAWSDGLTEVHAVTYAENTASQAVCRRLGMRHVGTTERYYDIACELFTVRAPVPT
jgi:RimJ/RimL family protein N-acetyltransferase